MAFVPITSTGQTGTLEINSTRDKDLPSISNTSGTDVVIDLTASGSWVLYNKSTTDPSIAPFAKPADVEGYQVDPSIAKRWNFRSPKHPAGCLLIEIKDAKGVTREILAGIKAKPNFTLYQGESAAFIINDVAGWYADNSGKISLGFSVKPARFTPVSPVPVPTPQPITTLFNTGVDGNRKPLGDSVKDPHYEMTLSPPNTSLPAVTTPNAALAPINWLPNSSTARWIGPNAPSATGPVGNFVYTLTFNLPEILSASVAGSLSVDDKVLDIRVNGVSAGPPLALSTWTSICRFQLSNGFVSGQNFIQFLVNTGHLEK
jgi:hypothetical protein